jgi:hypothetical protein
MICYTSSGIIFPSSSLSLVFVEEWSVSFTNSTVTNELLVKSNRPSKFSFFFFPIMSSSAAIFKDIRKSTTNALDRAKLVFQQNSGGAGGGGGAGGDDEQESIHVGGASETSNPTVDRLEELSGYCPQLTFQQRLIGFAASFSLGCEYDISVGFCFLFCFLFSHSLQRPFFVSSQIWWLFSPFAFSFDSWRADPWPLLWIIQSDVRVC